MITLNGSKWTDRDETIDVFDALSTAFGKDIAEPACANVWKEKPCGQTTSYMVEEGSRTITNNKCTTRFKKKGLNLIYAITHFSAYFHKEVFYIPVQLCNRCSAAKEGYDIAKNRPEEINKITSLIKSKPLTQVEQDEYRNVMMAAFNSTMSRIDQENKVVTVEKSRYRMKK